MAKCARTRPLRRWLCPALLGLVAACGDAVMPGGDGGRAALSVTAEYPAGHTTGSLGLVVDRVKVRVARPPAEWVVDTSATFPASATSMTVRVQVPLKARVERMEVVLELWAGPLLVFAGSRSVEVAEGAGTGQPTAIPLTYRGPGAEARNIRISPRDTVLRLSEAFRFGVEADNGSGVPVGDVYVSWSVAGNAAARVDPDGVLTAAAARGSVMLHARAATGARDSSRIWFAPAPGAVVPVGGAGQVQVVGSALAAPLVVRVTADDGLGVPGLLVHFNPPTGGDVLPAVARTDADGLARATAILGGTAGTQAFQATVLGLGAVQFQVQGTVDAPSQIFIVRGNNQVTAPGAMVAVPLEVVVRDRFGNRVVGARVLWDVLAGGGTLGLTETVTDLAGVALAAYTMGPVPMQNLVRATLEATGTSVVFVLLPPSP